MNKLGGVAAVVADWPAFPWQDGEVNEIQAVLKLADNMENVSLANARPRSYRPPYSDLALKDLISQQAHRCLHARRAEAA
jgi:hypothetical protein